MLWKWNLDQYGGSLLKYVILSFSVCSRALHSTFCRASCSLFLYRRRKDNIYRACWSWPNHCYT